LKNHPKLTKLASDGNFIRKRRKNIVKYADDRGILIVPEIDVPGHASALLTAYPEIGSKVSDSKVSYEVQRNSGIYNATLDPLILKRMKY
jgi:hexosaminidase